MLVVSKFLTGKLKRRTFDLVDRSYQVSLPQRMIQSGDFTMIGKEYKIKIKFDWQNFVFFRLEAYAESEDLVKQDDIVYLTPVKGNIHAFDAEEDTAVLDILIPNYEGYERFCNFYEEIVSNGPAMPMRSVKNNVKGVLKENGTDGQCDEDCEGQKKKKEVRLKYMMPPEDMNISILEYRGEM